MKTKLIVGIGLMLLVAAGCSSKSVPPASFGDSSPSASTAPANDAFATAVQLSDVPSTQQATTTGATLEAGEPRTCKKIDHTVWYSYSPSSPIYLLARASGDFSSAVGVYRGTDLTNLTSIGCAAAGTTSQIAFQAKPGQTYYIQVGGTKGEQGDFGLRLDFAKQNAILLGNPGPLPTNWVEKDLVPPTPVTVPVAVGTS